MEADTDLLFVQSEIESARKPFFFFGIGLLFIFFMTSLLRTDRLDNITTGFCPNENESPTTGMKIESGLKSTSGFCYKCRRSVLYFE